MTSNAKYHSTGRNGRSSGSARRHQALRVQPGGAPRLDRTIEEVWSELAAEGMADDDRALRTRLAQKLMAFACHGRGDAQAKELLLRTFRNETLAAANAEHVAEEPWSAA